MFLCKSHMINHCLINNEMQIFAARRHNAELFLHFLCLFVLHRQTIYNIHIYYFKYK